MSDELISPAEARNELFELSTSVRALLDWYDMTGVTGVPAGVFDPEPTSMPMPMPMTTRAATPAPAPSSGAAGTVSRDAPARSAENSFEPQAPREVPARLAVASFEQQRPPTVTLQAPQSATRAPMVRVEALTSTERMGRLSVLATEVAACQKCVLAETRTQTVFSRGNPFAELCFIGEGRGADEDRLGEPFVGAAGQLLDKMIAAMGYGRDEVYICNIVKCRPPNNRKPEPVEIAACKSYLVQQVQLCKPKYIVALGTTAIQGLLNTTEGITKLRGKWKNYQGIPVMPTYHPSYLVRMESKNKEQWMDLRKQVWEDLKQVMVSLGKTPPPRKPGPSTA